MGSGSQGHDTGDAFGKRRTDLAQQVFSLRKSWLLRSSLFEGRGGCINSVSLGLLNCQDSAMTCNKLTMAEITASGQISV